MRLHDIAHENWQNFIKTEQLAVKPAFYLIDQMDSALMCHDNVAKYVAEHGGRHVSGWMYVGDSFNQENYYHWTFHSIWQSPEGEYLDITQSSLDDYCIRYFWEDTNRYYDHDNGIAYGDLVIASSRDVAIPLRITVGQVYWHNNWNSFKPVEVFNGQYRVMIEKNIQLFCKIYDVTYDYETGLFHPLYWTNEEFEQNRFHWRI
jgi:hypothetical protein